MGERIRTIYWDSGLVPYHLDRMEQRLIVRKLTLANYDYVVLITSDSAYDLITMLTFPSISNIVL